jgi:AraC-like DNA-binding protein
MSELAQLAQVSRAAFAKRFHDVVGEPPMSYLTSWRMTLAAQALANTTATIAGIADRVGYSNEYAFATAFRRHFGVPPGRWRSARRRTHSPSEPDAAPAGEDGFRPPVDRDGDANRVM